MALVTLQTIFQDAFPAYEQTHPLPPHVRRAARAIMQCRTAALGGHVQACPDGHVARVWYNSCRHRACPQCAYLQTERWLARQQARLLACDHYHVIFTLPHDLNPLWLANVQVMPPLLFQVRIPRISATQSRGMLPRNPWECCHPVQRISATQSTECCHPRSVATLDCMISLCALLLSMAPWRSPLWHPVSQRCYRGSRGVHHR